MAMKRYTVQDLIDIIRLTDHELKRVPAKRELKNIVDSCIRSFGSWNNAVIAAGLKPNRSHSQRMYKRVNTKALDGHLCDSISEAIIDNWLTNHRIFHIKNVPYPGTNHKADWSIQKGAFIEYFGLAKDSPRYDRAIQKKRDLCRKHNIQLIEIYPWDLYPEVCLDQKLKSEFSNLGL